MQLHEDGVWRIWNSMAPEMAMSMQLQRAKMEHQRNSHQIMVDGCNCTKMMYEGYGILWCQNWQCPCNHKGLKWNINKLTSNNGKLVMLLKLFKNWSNLTDVKISKCHAAECDMTNIQDNHPKNAIKMPKIMIHWGSPCGFESHPRRHKEITCATYLSYVRCQLR